MTPLEKEVSELQARVVINCVLDDMRTFALGLPELEAIGALEFIRAYVEENVAP